MNALTEELERIRERAGIPAVSLAVYREGLPLFAHTSGLADPGTGAAASTTTRFRLGCLTKPVVAVAVLMQAAEGRLRLSAPVADYLPELARSGAPGLGELTIAQLLTHYGGLPRGTYFERTPSADDVLADIAQSGCLFAPGTTYKYSNWGYFVLAETLARVTGSAAQDVIRDTVLRPLGMRDTFFETTDVPVPGLAAGHWHRWHFGYPDRSAPLASCALLPLPPCSSGLVSTAADFAQFLNAIEHDHRSAGSRFWPGMVIEGLVGTILPKSSSKSVSLGLFREGAGDAARWYFPGTSSGFSAFLTYLPRYGVTGIALGNRLTCNHDLDAMLSAVIRETCPDVAPVPSPPPPPRTGNFVTSGGEPASVTFESGSGAQLAFRGERIPLQAHSSETFYPLGGPDRAHMLRVHTRDGNVSSLTWGRMHFAADVRRRSSRAVAGDGATALEGVYEYPGFGRAEVIHRNGRLYLDYGVVYETLLRPAGVHTFVQERGPCHGETIRFRESRSGDGPSFVMNGMEFRRVHASAGAGA